MHINIVALSLLPDAMKPKNLTVIPQIAIEAADLDASVNWYLTSFQCELIAKSNLTATLRFSNIELLLTLPSQEPRHLVLTHPEAASYGELCLRNQDSIASTYISDPGGNILKLREG